MTTTHKLLPCPFCGGKAESIRILDTDNSIACSNDECEANHLVLSREAWNRRHHTPAAKAMAQALRALADEHEQDHRCLCANGEKARTALAAFDEE